MKCIHITKASGDVQRFMGGKLIRSLRKAGATRAVAHDILRRIESRLYEGISTKELYQLAFQLLRKSATPLAARYSLKHAIFQLGPDGFGFEHFAAAILSQEDFRTECNVMLPGRCISHEIDVVGYKGSQRVFAECKFHNLPGRKCDVKVALYVYARALDLRQRAGCEQDSDFRLITNTKFSADAIRYAECVGLKLLGWNYPRGNGIEDLAQRHNLHPITCLTTLSSFQKKHLLKSKVVLCRDLLENMSALKPFRLSETSINRLRAELDELASSSN